MPRSNIPMSEYQARVSMNISCDQDDGFYQDLEFETDPESLTSLQENPNCDLCRGARYLAFEGKNGFVEASPCTCLESMNKTGTGWETYKAAQKKAALVCDAEIPNRYFKVDTSELQNEELNTWLDYVISNKTYSPCLFLYGSPGTGKTHSSLFLLLKYLKKMEGKSCLYFTTYNLLELRRKCTSYTYEDKQLKSEVEFEFNTYRNKVKNVDFLVLDELGQEPLIGHEKRLIFDIIDHRYSTNKITILISNHCDNKSQSLDGQLLSKIVGERISSRLKSAKSIYFTGEDKRLQEHSEAITKEDIERFMVPAKILTQDDNTHQIMTWLTRNPAFEVVSTQRRKQLSYVNEQGGVEDKDRTGVTIHENVWVDGDVLKIYGPVCDHEDKKLYALLLKELANSHREGNKGLTLRISLRKILELMGQACSGENTQRLKRQLNRLVRMSFDFKNAKGNRWTGPLLTEVIETGVNGDQKLQIHFSYFMITFYRLHAYTAFDKQKSKQLKNDSSGFYLFYSSHSSKEMKISVEACKKLLGIDASFDKKEALKRVKSAVDNLIKSGVMDAQKTFVKDGKVHTCLA